MINDMHDENMNDFISYFKPIYINGKLDHRINTDKTLDSSDIIGNSELNKPHITMFVCLLFNFIG